MLNGSRKTKKRPLVGVERARERMVDEFNFCLMNGSEYIVEVKSHGTKLNSV